MKILKCSYNIRKVLVEVEEDGKKEVIRIDRKNPIGSKQEKILSIVEPKIQSDMDTWKGKDFFFGDMYDYILSMD